jgi:hypothetical protein
VALSLIRALTSPDAELDRLQRGVGLPTRQSFYRTYGSETVRANGSSGGFQGTPLSPLVSMNMDLLSLLVENAFQRSAFPCYQQFSSILSSHLQRLLDLHKVERTDAEQMLASLKDRIRFLRSQRSCAPCDRSAANVAPASAGVPLPSVASIAHVPLSGILLK